MVMDNNVCQSQLNEDSIFWIGVVKFYKYSENYGYVKNLLLDEDYYFTLNLDEKRLRLIRVVKELNVGFNTAIDFLRRNGVDVEGRPNEMIDERSYRILEKEFRTNRSRTGCPQSRKICTGSLVFFRLKQVKHNRIYRDNAVDVKLVHQDFTNIEEITERLRKSVSSALLRKLKYIDNYRQVRILNAFVRNLANFIFSDEDFLLLEVLLKYYKSLYGFKNWGRLLKLLPYNEYTYKLWINDTIDKLFRSQEDLFTYVLQTNNPKSVIEQLFQNSKLSLEERSDICLEFCMTFGIKSESDLIWANERIYNVDETRLPIVIRLLRWTRSDNIATYDEQYLSYVYILPRQDQFLFFRKLLEGYRLSLYSLSTRKLLQIVNSGSGLDLGLHIVIKTLCKYRRSQQLLTDKELFDIIIGGGRKSKQQIEEMFAQISTCTLFNRCEKVLNDGGVPHLKHGFRLRSLPPTSTNYDIKLENGELYEKRQDYAPEVPFCEGKLSEYSHRVTKTPYHWCLGRSILSCIGISRNEDYKQYTLYDFVSIFSLNIDIKKLAEFYAQLNWFCLHYEHLTCKKCGYSLEPTEQNHYNAHRLTFFYCNNPQCEEFHNSIYINHCFQIECNHIIDSRDSKRCPNGFVICQKCGTCCAKSQFERKVQAGVSLGVYINRLYEENRFHLDNGEFYCPHCGTLLLDDTIEYGGEIIGVKHCLNHPDYVGVFPRMRHIKENNRIRTILKIKRN